jgi:hypothetical protein
MLPTLSYNYHMKSLGSAFAQKAIRCACLYLDALQGIPDLKVLVSEALAQFEETFPCSELAIMMHLMGHLPDQLSFLGPLRGHWMYPLESFLGFLKRAAKNRAQVRHVLKINKRG